MKTKSIEELIKMKAKKDEEADKIYTMYSDSIECDIKFKKANRFDIMTARDMSSYDADPYIIYNHVIEPNLKDTKLQKAYECDNPLDIVDKIFDKPEDLISISLAIIGKNKNINEVAREVMSDVKNS